MKTPPSLRLALGLPWPPLPVAERLHAATEIEAKTKIEGSACRYFASQFCLPRSLYPCPKIKHYYPCLYFVCIAQMPPNIFLSLGCCDVVLYCLGLGVIAQFVLNQWYSCLGYADW